MMRRTHLHRTLLAASVVLGLATLAGCGQPGEPEASAEAAVQNVLLNPADLFSVESGEFASGPVISGSLQPERQADLRAEVSAIVLQVFKHNGDKVQKGDLLVRLDDTSLRENLASAHEAERASQQAFDQAARQFDRLKTLSSSGAVSTQNLEDAEIRRNNAQSDLAAAKARVVQARQQMDKTEVRAPFAGIVSERAVSNGDTAQVGKALLKVIDPSSLRFEGFIAADQISQVQVGNAVLFNVNGYGNQQFTGAVERVSPMANSATRQVQVSVRIQGNNSAMVAGLFAEGRVQTTSHAGLMVPESALIRDGDHVYIWKVQDKKLHKTPIQLGSRDERRGDFEVKSGLVTGDQILRHPKGALAEGLSVEMESTAIAKAGG